MGELGVVDFEDGGEVFGEGFCWFARTLQFKFFITLRLLFK